MLKIDVFNHVLPRPYLDKLDELNPGLKDIGKRVRPIPVLHDMELRLRQLEEFGDAYRQVISLAAPPIESVADPQRTPELARVGNDEMARLVAAHDRFAGFIAGVPMNNPDATLAETKRAVEELGACGIQLYTNVNGRPLDDREFLPLFELVSGYDLPIWVHPTRGAEMPDYATEERSKYEIWWTFGWPYETSAMMARLVFSGYFDRFPGLKVITHHMGGMTPYFEGRVGPGMDQLGARTSDEDLSAVLDRLERRPVDYFRMFHADTALFGAAAATRCGLEFFGADRVLFASDSPFDPEKGPGFIRATLRVLDEELDLAEDVRRKLYEENARRLMPLRL